jgi:DNA polymerase
MSWPWVEAHSVTLAGKGRWDTVPDKKDYPGAGRFVPDDKAGLPAVAQAAQGCQGCDLFENATQMVFGRGAADAAVVLIGEQPGDAEDRAGQPFVGPAGQLLDRALKDAGLPPDDTYTTNAVKHFRWKPAPHGGKRRIHQKPEAWQIRACWPWLEAELARLAPRVVVTLGATAGQALFGSSFRITSQRGTEIGWRAPSLEDGAGRDVTVVPTIHPSAVLRSDDRDAAYAGLVSDLRVAAASLRR